MYKIYYNFSANIWMTLKKWKKRVYKHFDKGYDIMSRGSNTIVLLYSHQKQLQIFRLLYFYIRSKNNKIHTQKIASGDLFIMLRCMLSVSRSACLQGIIENKQEQPCKRFEKIDAPTDSCRSLLPRRHFALQGSELCIFPQSTGIRSPLALSQPTWQTQFRKGKKCIYLHDHSICTFADVSERGVAGSDFKNLSADNFKCPLPIICGHFFRWHKRVSVFAPQQQQSSVFQIASGLISPVRR